MEIDWGFTVSGGGGFRNGHLDNSVFTTNLGVFRRQLEKTNREIEDLDLEIKAFIRENTDLFAEIRGLVLDKMGVTGKTIEEKEGVETPDAEDAADE